MPVLSLACHLPHNTPNIPSRYNNEQTTKQTKAINNSYIYISHVNVTQTVPDISPLMHMHQDPLLVVYPVTKLSSECDRWCSSKAMQGSNPGGPGPRDTVRSSRRKTPENCQEWDKVFAGFKYGGLENDGLPRSSPCFPHLQCCYMILSAPGPLVWSRMFSHNRREGNITWANERKMAKYSDLQQECEDGGRRCQVFPVEAGCLLCMAPYSSLRPHTREALRKAQEAAESASA